MKHYWKKDFILTLLNIQSLIIGVCCVFLGILNNSFLFGLLGGVCLALHTVFARLQYSLDHRHLLSHYKDIFKPKVPAD